MCQQLTQLAASSDTRQVLCCEHGTLHLNWDAVTIFIDVEGLVQLMEITQHGLTLSKPARFRHKACQLFVTKQGSYQLWVRTICLNLRPPDFIILADLVRIALKAALSPKKPPAGLITHLKHTVKASANLSFSVN